ncbi:MAG TPA: cation diffusion facilitator family transporter [Actinocatenispora sp.]
MSTDDGSAAADGGAVPSGQTESLLTIVVAGGANLLIAGAKLAAGVLGGSSSMVSEAAHSFADTVTEVLLFVAVRRGARPATAASPFGYGREAYFWALLAAMFTFGAGGVFAVYHGVHSMLSGERTTQFLLSYVVLAVSAVLEGTSLVRSLHQVRGAARRVGVDVGTYIRLTPDTAVRAVTLEDTAALLGIVLAATGLGLEQATGSTLYDGLASVLIGVLLCLVAYRLIAANKALLIGLSVPSWIRDGLVAELTSLPGVAGVPELFATYLGPEQILVAAKIDFVDDVPAGEVERIADEGARRLRARFPKVSHVYLDPTAGRQP